MNFEDPETVKTIQQFLHEHGYYQTLKQFEEELASTPFDPNEITISHKLETIMMGYQEATLKQQLTDLELDDKLSNEKLLEGGAGDFAKLMLRSLDKIHLGNILAIAFSYDKESKVLATGSTDKTIRLTNYETQEKISEFSHHKGAVISLSFNPVHSHLLLSASMDGTHSLIDTKNNKVLQTFNDHSKYVVFIRWSLDGLSFATASHDHTACLYKRQSIDSPFQVALKMLFDANAESISFNKSGILAVSVRDSNYLHLVNVNTLERTKFNLNASRDDHISFTPMHVSFGSSEYLLVSTDKDRLILYREGNSTPARNFWGAPNDAFSSPRNSWDPSGKYVYSTGQDHKIYVWEVASQSVVHKLEGHNGIVRDICYHPNEKMLATCSFDKSVKLWVPQ